MPMPFCACWCGCARQLGNLGVVAREFERAIEQVMHHDRFVDHLVGGGRHPLAQQVAPAEFVGRQADRLGHMVHVPLQRKQALRCAEAPEGPMWRRIRRVGFGGMRMLGQ